MALQVTIEVGNSGVTAEYWRIRHGAVDFPLSGGALVTITIDGRVSQAARDQGKDPPLGAQRTLNIQFADAAQAEGLTKSALYGVVKDFPEFTAAIDV